MIALIVLTEKSDSLIAVQLFFIFPLSRDLLTGLGIAGANAVAVFRVVASLDNKVPSAILALMKLDTVFEHFRKFKFQHFMKCADLIGNCHKSRDMIKQLNLARFLPKSLFKRALFLCGFMALKPLDYNVHRKSGTFESSLIHSYCNLKILGSPRVHRNIINMGI